MASRRTRNVLVALLVLAAALAAVALLPRWLCSPSTEITLRSFEVVNGQGRIHYDIILPAGSSLAVGWARGGTDQSEVEIPARLIPGWPRRESRVLNLGSLNETKMKIKDEILQTLYEKTVTLEWNKPYRMEQNDRLQFARG